MLAIGDVLVENYRPGVMDRLGYGWTALHARWPRLIMCSISGYGQTGPLASYGAVDTIIQAASGMLGWSGAGPSVGLSVGRSLGTGPGGTHVTCCAGHHTIALQTVWRLPRAVCSGDGPRRR